MANGDSAAATKLIIKFSLSQFEFRSILPRLVEAGEMQSAWDLVKDDVILQKHLVKLLVEQKKTKDATKVVRKFKLDAYEFPQLVELVR